jgi:hypothetical protein
MMMNWERFDRKRSWLNFKILFQDSPGGTEENHESPQSGKPDARAENRTRDLTEYEAEVLPTRQGRLVIRL